jgi:ribonuclease BN (tRNA processing enzyme)
LFVVTDLPAQRFRGRDGADLLIAEAYYDDKAVPYHLRYADLVAHRADLNSGRIVLTHMSSDMLARAAEGRLVFETARDRLTIQV